LRREKEDLKVIEKRNSRIKTLKKRKRREKKIADPRSERGSAVFSRSSRSSKPESIKYGREGRLADRRELKKEVASSAHCGKEVGRTISMRKKKGREKRVQERAP